MKSTSIKAFNQKKKSGTIETDWQKIYRVLRYSRRPMTYCEIAVKLWWTNPNKVSRRLKEMIEKRLIEESGIRNCTVAGTKCLTYKAIFNDINSN